jgi:hypothetical protein
VLFFLHIPLHNATSATSSLLNHIQNSYFKIMEIKSLNFETNPTNTLLAHEHLALGTFAIFANKNTPINISTQTNAVLTSQNGKEINMLFEHSNPIILTDSSGIMQYNVSGKLAQNNNNSGLYYGTYNVTISY